MDRKPLTRRRAEYLQAIDLVESGLTRPALAALFRCRPENAGRILDGLVRAGLVKAGGYSYSETGRPARVFRATKRGRAALVDARMSGVMRGGG